MQLQSNILDELCKLPSQQNVAQHRCARGNLLCTTEQVKNGDECGGFDENKAFSNKNVDKKQILECVEGRNEQEIL